MIFEALQPWGLFPLTTRLIDYSCGVERVKFVAQMWVADVMGFAKNVILDRRRDLYVAAGRSADRCAGVMGNRFL